MKKNLATSLAVASLLLAFGLAAGPLHARDSNGYEVQFAAGASSKKMAGRIKGKNDAVYQVRASEGQTMKVSLKAQRATTYFNVNPPGSDQSIFIGSNEGTVYEGRLPASGVYEIVVYQMGGAASDNQTSKFDLTISVTGGHGAAGSSFSAGQNVEIAGARSDAVDALELRDGPGRGGVVGRLGNGRLMTVDNCDGNWCHVRTSTGSGVAGWVESRYLRSK